MSFSAFIKDNVDALVADFEAFARTLPAGRTMSTLALRDHSREILLAVAADMALPLSDGQRVAQSEAIAATPASTGTAAAEHGALRRLAGFDMVQLFAEFRALRASVTAFWQGASGQASGAAALEDVIRFNEGMDKALTESVHRYSSEVAASRDMFLAVLGHDLRGPLSGVNMAVLLLAKPELSEARAPGWVRAYRSVAPRAISVRCAKPRSSRYAPAIPSSRLPSSCRVT